MASPSSTNMYFDRSRIIEDLERQLLNWTIWLDRSAETGRDGSGSNDRCNSGLIVL